MEEKEKVLLNNEALSKEDFEKKKKELEEQVGVKVVKISEGKYKTRLQG
ncbi:MAG: hypothetical protein GF311_28470 [Candidatus Lokiarchaeota archaeon]|nr:hypothetical protein [Candidatus Lokiarchaeota archaeon]